MNKCEAMAAEKTNAEPAADVGGGGGMAGLRRRAARTLRNVTVEPLLAGFQLSSVLSGLTTQNLNLQKACRVNMALDAAVCAALDRRDGPSGVGVGGPAAAMAYRHHELDVQRLVAGMMVWQNAVQNAVPCALIVFVGSWSDRHRTRKPFMLIPVVGELVRNVGLIACVYYFSELPMEVAGLVESVPSSITGGLPVLFLAVFAYVGDITAVEDRTLRVGLVSLFASISVPVGSALSGVLFREYRFYGVYAISTALYLFSLIYGMMVIRDPEPPTAASEENGRGVDDKTTAKLAGNTSAVADFFDLKHIKDAFRVAFKRDNDNRRTDIILLLIVVVILVGPLSGEQTLMYLLTRVQFNWNEVNYSVFSTYYFICNLIGIGFTLSVLVNRFGFDDRLIGALGCLSKGLAAFVYAFAPNEFVFYMGPIVDIFHGVAFVAMRSLLSKLVPPNELGQVLAVFSIAETAVPAIFRPLYSVVYQRTLHLLPGAFYILGGILNLPGVLIFLWMYKKNNRIQKDESAEEKQALSAEPHC